MIYEGTIEIQRIVLAEYTLNFYKINIPSSDNDEKIEDQTDGRCNISGKMFGMLVGVY